MVIEKKKDAEVKSETKEELTTQEKIVADALTERIQKEPAFGPDEKTEDAETSVEEKESETSEAESESATDENTDDESSKEEKSDEVDEDEEDTSEEDTSNEEDVTAHVKASMQKRIDKVTAEKKALEERVARLESNTDKQEDKKDPVYTKEQLKAATRKFMDEGDADGMFEVMEYMANEKTKALRKEYLDEQVAIRKNAEAKQREWQSVEMHYSNDDDPSLDIRKSNSVLFKVAKKFYEDPEIGPTYLVPGGGGMLQAVADALTEILKYRADKGIKEKKPFIKAKEVKARRKSAMAGTGSMKQEGTFKKSSGSELDDYLAERKAALANKKGFTGD